MVVLLAFALLAGVSPATATDSPRVWAVSPAAGPEAGGERVTLRGRGFTRHTRVYFGKTRGTFVRVLSPRRLRVTTPAHAPGSVRVRVASSLGWSPLRSAPTYTFEATATSAFSRITAGDSVSAWPAISGDGSKIAFGSSSSNLAGDLDPIYWDIFVYDTANQAIRRLTRGGTADYDPPSISRDGRYVTFGTNAVLVPEDVNGLWDVYVVDTTTGEITRCTAGNGDSSDAAISADGHFVVFESSASDLLPGDANDGLSVYRYSLADGSIERIAADASDPATSGDGRFTAFTSRAAGEPYTVAVFDAQNASTVHLPGGNLSSEAPAISENSGVVAYYATSDTGFGPPETSLMFFDLLTLSSFAPLPGVSPEYYPVSLSADGTRAIFASSDISGVPGDTTETTDVFVLDPAARDLRRVTAGTGGGFAPSVTADGHSIVFVSGDQTLAPGGLDGMADIFRYDEPLN